MVKYEKDNYETFTMEMHIWFKYDLVRSTMHPTFEPTGIRTHDLQIMTAHVLTMEQYPEFDTMISCRPAHIS